MSELYAVQTGKKKQPLNIALVGTAGIGKSTFASQAPLPIFLGSEETGEMDVARMPRPSSFSDLLKQYDHLIKNKGLGYQTAVLDTLDSAETLVHRHLLETDAKKSGSMIAAHGGYGKAYDMAASMFLELRDRMKLLRDEHGMNIILIAHAKKATATDSIIGMSYDTQEMALHAKAQAIFADWVSAVLFATYIVNPQAGTNTDKIFAMGDGHRVLLTEKRPGHIGKNRFNLPYEMPLDFNQFKAAIDKFYDHGPGPMEVISTIAGLCENVDETLKEKVVVQVKKAKGDLALLAKIETRLREVIQNGVSADA